MELINIYETKNKYNTKNWDTEHTFKYLFDVDSKLVEIGYFIHYKSGVEVKKVIELSSSYGCPMKCKFCASEKINDFKLLKSEDLLAIVDYLFCVNNLSDLEQIVVPITGIGDLYFTIDAVVNFIIASKTKYPNLVFDVSTIKLNQKTMEALSQFKDSNWIRNIQITFVGKDDQTVNLSNYLKKEKYNFEEIVSLIQNSAFNNFRINYVMIENINDGEETFQYFIKSIISIKKQIKVRISKINETNTSIFYGLMPPKNERLERLNILLEQEKIDSYIFYSLENDNMNCGQLISEVNC